MAVNVYYAGLKACIDCYVLTRTCRQNNLVMATGNFKLARRSPVVNRMHPICGLLP